MSINSLIALKKVIVIELILFDSGYRINAAEVSIHNNRLRISPMENDSTDIEAFLVHLKKEIPVCMTVTGKGVIIKQIKNNESNKELLIKSSFMLESLEDFVYNLTDNNSDTIWISIIRKNIILEILERFKSAGVVVVDIFIGPLAISSLSSLISDEILQTGFYKIGIDQQAIISIDINNENADNYTISGKDVTGNLLIPLASAYRFLILQNSITSCILTEITYQNNDFKVTKSLQYLSLYGIVTLFLILLINFMIFGYFEKNVNRYNVESLETRTLIEEKNALLNELGEKEKVINNIGFNRTSKLSYFVDSIASSKPYGILFDELNVNPSVIDLYNKSSKISMDLIIIKGTAMKAAEINQWIKELSATNWIDSIKVNEMKYSNLKGKIDFKFYIKTKNENFR